MKTFTKISLKFVFELRIVCLVGFGIYSLMSKGFDIKFSQKSFYMFKILRHYNIKSLVVQISITKYFILLKTFENN